MIEDVKDLDAELKAQVFGESCVFEDAEISVAESWPNHDIAAQVAKVEHRNSTLKFDRQRKDGARRTAPRVAWVTDSVGEPPRGAADAFDIADQVRPDRCHSGKRVDTGSADRRSRDSQR